MQAAILAIGDELVLGQSVDTNSAYLSAELSARGIITAYHVTVHDDRAQIAEAIRQAIEAAELVIATGGLGPTEDDLTRFALADAMGETIESDAAALEQIEAYFNKLGRTMHETNRVQAMCPRGARMIENTCGTAPGIAADVDGTAVWVMPGVPREMREMFTNHVLPQLPGGVGRVILTRKINTFGAGESAVAGMLGDLAVRDRNPLIGTTVANGVVSVRIRSAFDDADEAQRQLDLTTERVEQVMGPLVFGRDDTTLAQSVGALLKERKKTVAVAESCTGGLIGKMLTDCAGSSEYAVGGWITYTNQMKTERLGVPDELITEHGAVSEPIVRAMAEGALARSGADHAIAVSGIAGPAGGTADKPVGTVWVGLAGRGLATETAVHRLHGEREMIRLRAALVSLNTLRLRLIEPESV